MAIIYEFDFPCGCRTGSFNPREWKICDAHEDAQDAILYWAGVGQYLFKQAQRSVDELKDRDFVRPTQIEKVVA